MQIFVRWSATAILFSITLLPVPGLAQQNQNQNQNQGNFGGILINAEGVVRSLPRKRISPTALKQIQRRFAEERLPDELIVATRQRTLSLKSLEADVAEKLARKLPLSDAVRYLAGIHRLDYVVVDLEQNDILISGPAEGFGPNETGRMVGLDSGRPPLQLDDLVVSLRSAMRGDSSIGCSIDPTRENMARLQQFINSNSGATSTSAAVRRIRNMGTILGMQEVSVWGVPGDSHFALALVEADYRMKRISLGLESSGVRGIRSHLSLIAPQGNSLQRWWFVPYYEPLATNEEKTLFQLSGQRAQLMAQEEISDDQGRRSDAFITRQSTEKFAELFTLHFSELAQRSPEFAELQNLYDMALLAHLIKQQVQGGRIRWDMQTFLKNSELPVESYAVPRYVSSESTSRKAHRGLVIGLIGGVTIDVEHAAGNSRVMPQLESGSFQQSSSDGWWWNTGK